MHKDIGGRVKTIQSLAAQAITATGDGSSADTAGHGSAVAIFDAGTQAGTSTTVRVEESDDDSTWNVVADADLTGGTNTIAITIANDAQIHKRGYVGAKRYLRWSISAVTASNLPGAGLFVLGEPATAPVA